MARLALLCGSAALGVSLLGSATLAQEPEVQEPEVQGPAVQEPAIHERDPLEPLNRVVFSFNHSLHDTLLRPVSGAYGSLPQGVQRGIDNFFSNLREPVVTVASVLQGDGTNSAKSAGRFVVNSTAGIAGIFDVATPLGLVSRPEDLGLTLCHYGVPHGAYLVLPLVGPSSGRDFAGLAATYAATFNLVGPNTLPYLAVDGMVAHAADEAPHDHELPDFYALVRESYLTKRSLACDDVFGPDELKASPFGQVAMRTTPLDTAVIDASEAVEEGERLIDDVGTEAEEVLEELSPDASAPAAEDRGGSSTG